MSSRFLGRRHRWLPLLALTFVAGGCVAPSSEGADRQLASWCSALADMAAASQVFERDPSTVSEGEWEDAYSRGEAFFATPAPAEVRNQVALLSDEESEAGFGEVDAALRDVHDFAEANCDNIDPELFDASE